MEFAFLPSCIGTVALIEVLLGVTVFNCSFLLPIDARCTFNLRPCNSFAMIHSSIESICASSSFPNSKKHYPLEYPARDGSLTRLYALMGAKFSIHSLTSSSRICTGMLPMYIFLLFSPGVESSSFVLTISSLTYPKSMGYKYLSIWLN